MSDRTSHPVFPLRRQPSGAARPEGLRPSATLQDRDTESGTPPVRRVTLAMLLIAAGLLAYENSMSGAFVFDDIPCIVENEALRSLDSTWNAAPEDIPGGLRRRIVGRWTFALNYAAGGLNVWGYHLVNVSIHIIAGLLLMGLVRRTLLLPGTTGALREHSTLLPFCIALLWLVHPIQTESVTYIVQRLEALMGMFFLASLYSLVRSHTGHPALWQTLAVLTGWLCLGTKEVGLMLPPVALLFDRVFLSQSWKEVLQRRGVMHALLLTAMIGYFAVGIGKVPYYAQRPDAAGERASSWEFLRSQPGVLLYYLAISFWPGHFCLDLLWPVARDPWEIYGKGALIVGALVAGFVLLRRQPASGFLIVSFFLILAPSSTIVPLHLAFVHRMYLSLACLVIGVVLAVYWSVERLSRRWHFAAPAAAASVTVLLLTVPTAMALTVATRACNDTYRSPVALWQHVVQVAPHNVRGHMNLAGHLAEVRRHDEAEAHYQFALQVKPSYDMCWYNYGVYLHNDRRSPEKALLCLEEAIALQPQKAKYHFALASALEDTGDIADAEAAYRQAIKLDPDDYEPHHNLGRLLRMGGRFPAARQSLLQAIRRNPSSWLTHRELARLALDERQAHRAVRHYEDALECSEAPGHWLLRQELAWVLATTPADEARDGRRALHLARSVIDEQPARFVGWDTLAAAQAELGRFESAIESIRRAIALAKSSEEHSDTVRAMQQRVELYQQSRPYRAAHNMVTRFAPGPDAPEAAL